MTQILVYRTSAGIAMAADSRAVTYPADPERRLQSVQKLFVLTPHVVMLTAGAGYGVLASRKFQAHVSQHSWWGFDEIRRRALPFLRAEIDQFRREGGTMPDHADLQRVYFVLAGYVPQAAAEPFQLELLGAESGADLLHAIKTGPVIAVPRQMGVEYRLNKLSLAGKGLEEAEALSEACLIKLAGQTSEVGLPFHFVRITAAGVTIRSRDEDM